MQQQTLFGKFKQPPKEDKMIIEEKPDPKRTMPWVEKYRPSTISELSYQEEVTRAMQGAVTSGSLPHLLFYGPPGTGKTSCILAVAKDLFGSAFYRKRILELNASDDRGIAVVREKIKKFAETAVTKNPDPKYPCPSFKIIILDEADLMTTEAQSALRRIIEDNSSTTRFCIICNYITKIIEPLSSRCVKFRFKPISEEAQVSRLEYICNQESLAYQKPALFNLVQITEGDLRRSVNLLQSIGLLYDKEISEDGVEEVSGIVPEREINKIFGAYKQGSVDGLIKVVDNLLMEGYSPEQLINQYFEAVLNDGQMNEVKKCRILEKISACEAALNEGGRDDLQLYNLFSSSLAILTKPL